MIYRLLDSDIIVAAKNPTSLDYVTAHKSWCVVSLISIFLRVCVKNLSGTKVDPLYDGLQIISSTFSYTQKSGVYNSNFWDAVNAQILATAHQYRALVFWEHYHKKILSDDGLTLKNYQSFSIEDKDRYINLTCELITSCLIV